MRVNDKYKPGTIVKYNLPSGEYGLGKILHYSLYVKDGLAIAFSNSKHIPDAPREDLELGEDSLVLFTFVGFLELDSFESLGWHIVTFGRCGKTVEVWDQNDIQYTLRNSDARSKYASKMVHTQFWTRAVGTLWTCGIKMTLKTHSQRVMHVLKTP